MKPWPTFQWWPGLHYSVDLRIQTYTKPDPLKYGKLATKISVDMQIFVQCTSDTAFRSSFYYTLAYSRGRGIMRRSIRLSICLCHAPSSTKQCTLMLQSLQNTNRKPHGGSRTLWSEWPCEVAETATKPSPSPLQKHSLGGCTIHICPCRTAVSGGHIVLPRNT